MVGARDVVAAGQATKHASTGFTKETGVFVGGTTPAFVGQHIDDRSGCVFRVQIGSGAPTDVACPARTEAPDIPLLLPWLPGTVPLPFHSCVDTNPCQTNPPMVGTTRNR